MNQTQIQTYISYADAVWNKGWLFPVLISAITYGLFYFWKEWSEILPPSTTSVGRKYHWYEITTWSDLCFITDMCYWSMFIIFLLFTAMDQLEIVMVGFTFTISRLLHLIPVCALLAFREYTLAYYNIDHRWLYEESRCRTQAKYLQRHLNVQLIVMFISSVAGWYFCYQLPTTMRIVKYIPLEITNISVAA